MYIDANNLYGYAMSKFLLTGGFQLIDPQSFTWINILAMILNDEF